MHKKIRCYRQRLFGMSVIKNLINFMKKSSFYRIWFSFWSLQWLLWLLQPFEKLPYIISEEQLFWGGEERPNFGKNGWILTAGMHNIRPAVTHESFSFGPQSWKIYTFSVFIRWNTLWMGKNILILALGYSKTLGPLWNLSWVPRLYSIL